MKRLRNTRRRANTARLNKTFISDNLIYKRFEVVGWTTPQEEINHEH